MIYSPENAGIGEIHGGEVSPHYLVLARQLGLNFTRFAATPVASADDRQDMRADRQTFANWLESRA
jgi:hypothetical protein